MVGSDGGIFAFGDAAFHGSMGATASTPPCSRWCPTPTGWATGWWPPTAGSSPSTPPSGARWETTLNKPVTGMVAFGNGYLMVAEDGGIFNFSDRDFHGSLGNRPPNHPVTAITAITTLDH